MNRAQRRVVAREVVKRGKATGHETRVSRTVFAKAVLADEIRREQAELEETVEQQAVDHGLVVAKPKLWTPEEGSK